MPGTSLETFAAWSNYHLTIGDSPAPGMPPAITVARQVRNHCSDADEHDAAGTIVATAGMLMKQLSILETMRTKPTPVKPEPGNFASGIVGRAWSFERLIGTPVSQIIAEGLAWCADLPESMRGDNAKSRNLCLAGGGTRLREIVSWAEKRGLSIATSGTHLGPSIAGGFGTASHGSRLGIGIGGLQDIVRGLHIVVGQDRHVWLQRKSDRIVRKGTAASLVASYRPDPDKPTIEVSCTLIEDDALFDAALVHLGCMGIVNAVALELIPAERFAGFKLKKSIDEDWLKTVSDGKFDEIANRFGAGGLALQFYELTIDPFKPFSTPAAHLLYFHDDTAGAVGASGGVRPSAADAIGLFAQGLAESHVRLLDAPPGTEPDFDAAIQQITRQGKTVYEAYLALADFVDATGQIDIPKAPIRGSWGEIHGDEISGDLPGALYNASYAIPLDRLHDAIPAICDAVKDLPGSFVYTVRFVEDPKGLLAFTRFGRNAVIEIDGLSPFVCERFLLLRRQADIPDGEVDEALRILAGTLEKGAMRVRAALEKEPIPYSMHWAKLGNLDAANVRKGFGQSGCGGPSPIERWRAAREEIIGTYQDGTPNTGSRAFFRNPAVERYGLLEPLPEPLKSDKA